MIPYKIHHIWLQGGIPGEYQMNYDSWDNSCKDWDHKVWDEESLLDLCSDHQVNQYMKIETLINRVNYLKYILMYNEGGVYADLDTYPVGDLNKFFLQDEIKDIDLEAKLSIRYPFNTEIPKKRFLDYDIILPARKTMFHYPDGGKPLLLDNPVLMSQIEDSFWLDLIDWCEERTNLKSSGLSEDGSLPHEPYGPYGMTDFLFSVFKQPYLAGILILPPTYLMADREKLNENTFIVHSADGGWKN